MFVDVGGKSIAEQSGVDEGIECLIGGAEDLLKRALAIKEEALGANHPELATTVRVQTHKPRILDQPGLRAGGRQVGK